MKPIVFFDGIEWHNVLPLTFTKPVAELRMGGLTFKQRWEKILSIQASYQTQDYLSQKYPNNAQGVVIYINPAFFPNAHLIESIKQLKEHQAIYHQDQLVAFCSDDFQNQDFNQIKQVESLIHIQYPWDLFIHNDFAISYDFNLLTQDKSSESIPSTMAVIGNPNDIFIEKGAQMTYGTLNAEKGKIFISKNSEIMEGSMIRGSLFLGEGATINMGSKIYGGTTIGPFCKVGGEVSNSILMQYSNKGHEGYLGNSVLGEWCNLGADTNISNLKNNYKEVVVYNYLQKKYIDSGTLFVGTIMGDHSKTAINTQFNTGTVVGVGCNIAQSGFPKRLIPNFTWGNVESGIKQKFNEFIQTADTVYKRRNKELTTNDVEILNYLYP